MQFNLIMLLELKNHQEIQKLIKRMILFEEVIDKSPKLVKLYNGQFQQFKDGLSIHEGAMAHIKPCCSLFKDKRGEGDKQ